MKKVLKLLFIFGIIVISVSFLWINHHDQMYEDSFQSNYYYDLTIKTLYPLENVTIYIPFPSCENKSSFVDAMYAEDNMNKPENWNVSIVETPQGDMLEITASIIEPEYRQVPVPAGEEDDVEIPSSIDRSDKYSEDTPIPYPISMTLYWDSDHELNTRDPFENELLFTPVSNIEQVPDMFPSEGQDNLKTYRYESLIYARYDTSEENTLDLSMSLTGSNEWWIYGWSGNSYNEHISLTLEGSMHEWIPVEGRLITGEGKYL